MNLLGTFKQLGPDDLVHVVKSIPNSRQQIKEVKNNMNYAIKSYNF